MSHFFSIHTLACTSSSLIPNTCLSCSIVCIDHYIHPVVGGHLGCFQFRDNMNSVSMNILGHVFWWTCVLIFLDYIPKNGITGSATVDAIRFPKWLYLFTLPSNICKFWLLHSFPITWYSLCHFNFSGGSSVLCCGYKFSFFSWQTKLGAFSDWKSMGQRSWKLSSKTYN